MSKEFIGGETGGIPKDIFRPAFNSAFLTKSGEMYHAEISHRSVEIRSTDYQEVVFRACVSANSTLNLDIRNKLKYDAYNEVFTGPKDADLYPSKLLDHTMKYFEEQNTTIERIKGRWAHDSDNFHQFVENCNGFVTGEFSEKNEKAAAKKTWTGRQAARFGYTDVAIEKIASEIVVNFIRPNGKTK